MAEILEHPRNLKKPDVRLQCVTPGDELRGCMTRFCDTSAISPSGRWIAVTRLPAPWRYPAVGELAEVVLIDLETGEVWVIEETPAFDNGMGAQVQWGRTDEELYYNTLDDRRWVVRGVTINPLTGERRLLGGPIYCVSPDGSRIAGLDLIRLGLAAPRRGGVAAPRTALPVNIDAPAADGITITYTRNGISRLEYPLRHLLDRMRPPLAWGRHVNGGFYLVHLSWNSTGNRLLAVVRFRPHDPRLPRSDYVLTINESLPGSEPEIFLAIDRDRWPCGGSLPMWHPDGQHICFTVNFAGKGLRFAKTRFDGKELHEMAGDIPGSGTPVFHRDRPEIFVADTLPEDAPLGQAPLRWIDLKKKEDHQVAQLRLPVREADARLDHEMRVNPVWDRTGTLLTLNGMEQGERRVYLADFTSWLKPD